MMDKLLNNDVQVACIYMLRTNKTNEPTKLM